MRRKPNPAQLELFLEAPAPAPKAQAWSSYLAKEKPELSYAYRTTPAGEPTVADLVKPGMLVRTSYSTGGRVVSVLGPYSYEAGEYLKEAVPEHYTIVFCQPEAWEAAQAKGRKVSEKQYRWLNEVVAVGGRLLKLFEACPDEVFVELEEPAPAPEPEVEPVEQGPVAPADVFVLMACSATKRETELGLPLFELYDGPMWQTLRMHLGAIPRGNVMVLSGKLGFRSAQTMAKPYEEKISAAKVSELLERGIENYPKGKPGCIPPGPTVLQEAGRWSLEGELLPWRKVIIAGAGEYRRAFLGLVEQLQAAGLIAAGAEVLAVEGGIGTQRGQLGAWLREANGELLQAAA